ncbi:hypothetical protein ACA910_000718 [Epithemia clementina (nom. ined.)]
MSDEDELYDEFGNYIGPDLDSSDDDDDESDQEANLRPNDDERDASDVSEDDDEDERGRHSTKDRALISREEASGDDQETATADPMSAIVLHEDKEHYPSAEQVFGEEVRTAVLDEDAMEIETPLVQPLSTKYFHHQPKEVAADPSSVWMYTDDYLSVQLSSETTRTRRGIAVVGHFHHGKTSLVDLLLEPTLKKDQTWGDDKASLDSNQGGGPRYTDILMTERERQMSLVSTPLTALFPDTRGKNYCFTLLDCPGHVNFHDETVAALRVTDGALLVVDAVEGIMLHTEMVIRQIVQEGLPLVLCLTKVDRLLVELKLPPNDCYFKLQHVIESVNDLVQETSQGRYPKLSPNRGNVAFSSAQHGWIFTLESFTNVYLEHHDCLGENLSAHDLAQRLWGEVYMDPKQGTFHKSPHECPTTSTMTEEDDDEDDVDRTIHRTFVALILLPMYKIYTACLAEREPDVNRLLRSVGVFLSKKELRASARPLLRSALRRFLQSAHGGLVEAVVRHIPCPAIAAPAKIARCYTGPVPKDASHSSSKRVTAMKECDPNGPLMIHAVKQYTTFDGQSFLTLGRIYSGTVRPATVVKVMGESYTPEDEEDVATATIEAVFIPRGPLRTEVTFAKAGNWVLLQGIDATISKTATIAGIHDRAGTDEDDDCYIFAPLKFPQAGGESIMKLAIEPLNPAELPKMVEGLRRVSKAYPMVKTKVEESGEHIVLGTGELYLDCVMHDLRQVYSDVEVKVADPVVSFRETVVDTSSVKCFSETANKRNKLTFIAEPMDDGLAEKLETGKVNPEWDTKKLGGFFQKHYSWDLLSSRSIWAFGDSPTHGTNILMDDTLPNDIDKSLLNTCRSSIVQGFQWAMREGPLCEEPVRGTKLKLLDATLSDKPIYRGGGQVIPTARRTVHSALLTATPRLMEPVFNFQIQCPKSIVESVQPVLARRRGHIVQDRPIPGTTLYSVRGFLPVLDSFGFETDLRTFTQGQAMVYSVFHHWSIVPGDPLDRSIILHPLEPSPPQCLARELLIKTRRRKGLAEDVSINKFFDEAMKSQLLADEPLLSEVQQ